MKKLNLKTLWMLLALLVPQIGWGAFRYQTDTYYFGDAAQAGGSISNGTMTYNGNTVDISRFTFVEGSKGWFLRDRTEYSGQYGLFTNQNATLTILGLHVGDKVTITYQTANEKIDRISGAHAYNGTNGLYDVESGTEYTIAQDGDLTIQAHNAYTYIYTIKISRLTSNATYSITTQENNNTRSTTFAFTSEGRMEGNAVAVPFMEVEFGSDLNGVLVDADNGLGSYMTDWNGWRMLWPENHLPYQATFYKFKPTAKGTFQMKGQLSGGTVYLYELNENTNTLIEKTSVSGSGYVSLPNGWEITLEKGKTYYVCDNPDNRTWSVFYLHEFTFTNDFNMSLGKVLENGATSGELADVNGASSLNSWSVKKASGNIKTSGIGLSYANNKLSISGIDYKDASADKAGVIILDLDFDAGDATFVVTIPYSAEKGHVWNFYDTSKSTNAGNGLLEIGQYKTGGSQLKTETDNGEWEFTYRVINQYGQGTHDPMYKNVYDMEGDNADMIWETEGLWFDTATKLSCLYNENDLKATEYTDRYVGILPGGSFSIPGLKKGDRVIIYMGSGDGSATDVCFFNITNALDAIGQSISTSDTYKAGGTMWNGNHGDYNLRGCYQFIAAADGPMKFYMNGGSMTKIYSIEIYQGKHKFTDDATRVTRSYNNETYTNTYQLLNTYQTTDNTVGKAAFQLHYRGKGESLRTPTVMYSIGNNSDGELSHGSGNLFYSQQGSEHNIFYKSVKGEAGLIRIRIDCMELGGNYVTDYGLQNITVGYLDKMKYPYTWDFTDLMEYAYTKNNNRIKAGIASSTAYEQSNNIVEFMNRKGFNCVELWKLYNTEGDACPGYGLHMINNQYNNNSDNEGSGELMFSSGSQLYAGTEFITEASGLGIMQQDNMVKRNGRLRITDEGLYLYEQSGNYWRVRVPEVPANAAVYLRAKAIPDRTPAAFVDNTSTAFKYYATTSDGEYVYAAKGTGADMTLFLSNMIVKKIAVATDAKTVNKLGWNTESRDHAIDPSLLPYMTGKDFRTYVVTAADKENNTVTLVRIDGGSGADANGNTDGTTEKLYVPAATDGSVNACIVRNADGEAVDLFGEGSGFHLFVPDMHDKATAEAIDLSGNLLKARVTATTEASGETPADKVTRDETVIVEENGEQKTYTYNNYAFTFKYKKVNEDGTPYTGPQEGKQAFYRIVKDGARSGGNQAYLSIEQSGTTSRSAEPSNSSVVVPEGYDIIFKDWSDFMTEKGDVNGDGVVTRPDIDVMTDYVTARKSNGLFKWMGDMNDDGKVDIIDLTLLIQKIMGE